MHRKISEEVIASYDALAEHWYGADFNRENGMEQHRRALRFASRSGAALDVGCGSSGRIIGLLLEAGYEAEGLDFSPGMIALARERHPDVTFYPADIVTWTFPRRYSFISAWDSVWHVPLAEQELVLRKLCAGLTSGGILIYSTGGVDEPEEVTNPFLGQPLYHAALGIPKILSILADVHCVCCHLEYDQARGGDPGTHVYLIVRRR